MASNKAGMTEVRETSGGLANILIRMLAIGVAGSAALIAAAKVLGEKIEEIELDKYLRLQEQREADKEEARRITAVEEGEEI